MQQVLSKRASATPKNLPPSSSNGQLSPPLHHHKRVKNNTKFRRKFTLLFSMSNNNSWLFSSSSRVQKIMILTASCLIATAIYMTYRIYHAGSFMQSSSYSYFRGLRTATYSNHNQLFDACLRQQKRQQQQGNNDNAEEKQQRWSSEQFRTKSKVRSMFNCDAKGALCQYYYPSNFFDEECGLGRAYAYQIKDAKAMMEKDALWPNMPAIGYPTLTMANLCINKTIDPLQFEPGTTLDESTLDNIGEHIYNNNADANDAADDDDRCMTERLSFIHVHKSGGTTLRSAIIHLAKRYNDSGGTQLVRHKWFQPPRKADISALTTVELERLGNVTEGTNIELDWPNEGRKYIGTVIRREMEKKKTTTEVEEEDNTASYSFTIAFEDGSVETMDLATESFRILDTTSDSDKLMMKLPPHLAMDNHLSSDNANADPSSATKAKNIETQKEKTIESLKHATTYPSEQFGPMDHVLFAIVREPTERFISSIGQAMGGRGSKRNLIGSKLQKECIKFTSAETLKCMAKYVRDHGHWIELHFAPQVIDISFSVMFQDVPVALFPFREIGVLIDYFGNYQESKYRDRPHPILENMTVDDYDDESLGIVCRIYEMDVIMQRSMGMEVPRCDPFI